MPIIEVYRHALANIPEGEKVSIVVGLQPDHPDRDLSVDETIAIFEREEVDVLASAESNGTKNGAHYVLSRYFVDTGEARKKVTVTDDCTNVHFQGDLGARKRGLRNANRDEASHRQHARSVGGSRGHGRVAGGRELIRCRRNGLRS